VTKLGEEALDRLVRTLRETVAERGISGLLLIDGDGRPVLLPWGNVAADDPCEAEEPVVRTRSYTLTLECGPCKTSGPHAGKRRCCELIGGDYICRWVAC
jgi:hypothetical protein